jgi:hypothetical protein
MSRKYESIALLELRCLNYVIGKSKILFLLRNWKTFGFIPTTLWENLRFYAYCVIGKSKILFLFHNWNCVVKTVEDIREAFANGIR